MTHETAESPTVTGPASQRDDEATAPQVQDAPPAAVDGTTEARGAEASGGLADVDGAVAVGDAESADGAAAEGAAGGADGPGASAADVPVTAGDAVPTGPAEPRNGPVRPGRLWRSLRWVVAAAVFAGLGSGTAYGISGLQRTDVPGLATRSDGRWGYPELSLPALPAGRPRPFTGGNVGQIHYADLRSLLLPAPAGATVDKKLDGGWVGTEQYLSEYTASARTVLGVPLENVGLRHIAARGWTMPDGTGARVYLLQFESSGIAVLFHDELIDPGLDAGAAPSGTDRTEVDPTWPLSAATPQTTTDAFVEPAPFGRTQKRLAYIEAGDTLALVVEEGKGSAPAVPFHQTVALQQELLG